MVKGLLIDIDGVLVDKGQVIPGAIETLAHLRDRDIPFRLLTNSTQNSRASRAQKLRALGLPIQDHQVITASYLSARYLERLGGAPCWVLVNGPGADEFAHLPQTDQAPEYVVLGDLAEQFNYAVLNRAFRLIRRGARLIAMQAEPIDLTVEAEPVLNVGAWVKLLEHATGTRAVVIGKPAPFAFEWALSELKTPRDQTMMVGDNPHTDLAGGQAAGLQTTLVRTGEFDSQALEEGPEPDHIIDSIADLPGVL